MAAGATGLDDSPNHNRVFGRPRHDSVGYGWLVAGGWCYWRMGYDLLIDLLAQCGFDAGQPSAARRMMQR